MHLTLGDYRTFLQRHRALIVHFSGCPKGAGLDVYYPQDLRTVIETPSMGLACSLILPLDQRPNAFGNLGLILDPTSAQSIVHVSHMDGGTYIDPTTNLRQPRDQKITPQVCEESLSRRGEDDPLIAHNEWVVEDSIVKGLFFFADRAVWDVKNDCPRSIQAPEILETFPGLPLYSIDGGQFKKRTLLPSGDPLWLCCTHADIYGW